MVAGRNTVVSLRMQMFDAQGELLEAPEDALVYLHGGYGGLLPALERAIEGKGPGESIQLQVEPDDAFGEYDADLLRIEPVERYGEGLAVGMEIEEDSRIYTVTDVAEGKVVLDPNHPLAGMALRFVCQVLDVRIATPEELARGVSFPDK